MSIHGYWIDHDNYPFDEHREQGREDARYDRQRDYDLADQFSERGRAYNEGFDREVRRKEEERAERYREEERQAEAASRRHREQFAEDDAYQEQFAGEQYPQQPDCEPESQPGGPLDEER